MTSSYFLVAHGSRDPRPHVACEKLAGYLRDRLPTLTNSPSQSRTRESFPLVKTGTLELTDISLAEQLIQFAQTTRSLGLTQIQLLPLFLLPGVHVQADIPTQVAIAQRWLGTDITVNLRPYLGSHPRLIHLLLRQQQAITAEIWILLAHGSRHLGGNQPVENRARQLGAIPAYWVMEPTLEIQIKKLVNLGYKRIGILPYFLFPGGITDAIAQKLAQLSQTYPIQEFKLAEPMGLTVELANLVLDFMQVNLTVNQENW